ncbi:MAG: flavodoxin domain-containing protein [Pseudomonadota bacterium]
MRHWLIIYHSAEGQTARIASHIARHIDQGFRDVRVRNINYLKPQDLAELAGIIVGTSMRWGRFPEEIRAFITEHSELLNRVPSALYTVSLSAASPEPRRREVVHEKARRLAIGSGWHPRQWATFAGAINPAEFGPVKRLAVRAVMKTLLGSSEPTAVGELTDWTAVHDFVDRVVPALA